MDVQLGILGAGNMAEAIAGGVIRGGLFKPNQLLAADVSADRRRIFTERLGVPTTDDNRQAVQNAQTILLSVKPQHMEEVLKGIRDVVRSDALVISIAAGISTRFIESHLGGSRRVIRTMPNTPMLIGEGMVAMARGRNATEDDARQARKLFETAAAVIDVSEDQLDAVTAVSGSGPAYIFYLVEQMIRAGTELGLSAEHSRQLAIKTALGAARMLASSDESPQELRRKVTSPGGTTQAAITYMEQHEFASTVVEALKAAAKRSRELGS